MLSYQHSYHAGCLADVLKHVTLTCLLDYMKKKDAPFFYLDTHAGRGQYDLKHPHALKTGEALEGIEKLWAKRDTLPAVFKQYFDAIEALNPETTYPRYYPGSPQLAINALRQTDRATFCERHPHEFEVLSLLNTQGKRVFFSESDGVHHLKIDLPPKERRGLIFMDPSYEIKDEYRKLPKSIAEAYQRFSSGTFCLWYPLLHDQKPYEQLMRGLDALKIKNTLRIELTLNKPATQGMIGSGMWIINPPFVLAEQIKPALNALKKEYHATTLIMV